MYVYPDKQIDTEKKLIDPAVLLYKSRDIERFRISILGGNIATKFRGIDFVTGYVQISISSVFRDLGYRYTSSLPLVAEQLIFTTSHPGAIEFLHERAGKFNVHWNGTLSELQCNISSFSKPPNEHTTQKQTALRCQTDSWSINDSVTTSQVALGKSKEIVLEGPGATSIGVWISISNEMFIGRSRFVLTIHGSTKESASDRNERLGLTPSLLGRRSGLEGFSRWKDG
jgi:Mn-containing catalase